ncbi:MAG: hypothetical protein AAF363_15430 [Bacteroidota bacterium]
MRKIISFLGLVLGLIFISSCSDDEGPQQIIINDISGIRIDLDWSTGENASQAVIDANLDLTIVVADDGSQAVGISENNGLFEFVSLSSANVDGDYATLVFYRTGTVEVTYKIIISGIRSTDNPFEITGTFSSDQSGSIFSVADITKKGNQFIINLP